MARYHAAVGGAFRAVLSRCPNPAAALPLPGASIGQLDSAPVRAGKHGRVRVGDGGADTACSRAAGARLLDAPPEPEGPVKPLVCYRLLPCLSEAAAPQPASHCSDPRPRMRPVAGRQRTAGACYSPRCLRAAPARLRPRCRPARRHRARPCGRRLPKWRATRASEERPFRGSVRHAEPLECRLAVYGLHGSLGLHDRAGKINKHVLKRTEVCSRHLPARRPHRMNTLPLLTQGDQSIESAHRDHCKRATARDGCGRGAPFRGWCRGRPLAAQARLGSDQLLCTPQALPHSHAGGAGFRCV